LNSGSSLTLRRPSMRLSVFLLVACLMAGVYAATDSCNGDAFGTPGDFDYYVFALSWSADFCNGSKYPGCINPVPFARQHLTIHGLWPGYNESRSGHPWPQCCPNSPDGQYFDWSVYQALKADLDTYWPDAKLSDPTPQQMNQSFWNHEWNKHGTCSGLSQMAYFTETLYHIFAAVPTPALISNSVGSYLTQQQVYNAFGSPVCGSGQPCAVGIDCSKKNQFTQVLTCWDHSLRRITCPAASVGKKTCTQDTIYIPGYA